MAKINALELDIDIFDSSNPKKIVVRDASSYLHDTVESPTLSIKLPGFINFIDIDFHRNSINILNSNTLRLTNVITTNEMADLPDGLYQFRYSICPNEKLFVVKNFMKTTLAELALARIIAFTSKCNQTQEFKNSILDIIYLLQTSKYLTIAGQLKDASDAFFTINKQLQSLEKNQQNVSL